jgi:two-component system, OmpR family, response regulator
LIKEFGLFSGSERGDKEIMDTVSPDIQVTIVEDNLVLLEELSFQLRCAGYQVRGVPNALELDKLLKEWHTDVFIVDINLPGEDGFSIVRRIHDRTKHGIIMLSARFNVEDKTRCLESGADVYLVKPTDWQEISAYIQSLYKRLEINTSSEEWVFQRHSGLLTGPGNQSLQLTHQESKLLTLLLIANANKSFVTREAIIQAFDMSGNLKFDTRINTMISRLRDSLCSFCPEANIQSRRNLGYIYQGPHIELKA